MAPVQAEMDTLLLMPATESPDTPLLPLMESEREKVTQLPVQIQLHMIEHIRPPEQLLLKGMATERLLPLLLAELTIPDSCSPVRSRRGSTLVTRFIIITRISGDWVGF